MQAYYRNCLYNIDMSQPISMNVFFNFLIMNIYGFKRYQEAESKKL